MFCNRQIVKLNTTQNIIFSDRKIKYLQNLIPIRYIKNLCKLIILTLIKVGFLGVGLRWWMVGGEGVGKITPCLTLVRTMQEAINLAHKYTHRFSLQKYTF